MADVPIGVPPRLAEIEAELLAPGGAFELVEADVAGERMSAFAKRIHDLREVLVSSAGFGEAEYLIFDDGTDLRRFTYAEHAQLVASTAAVLRDDYGVGPGHRVALLGANSPEWIVAFWATVSLGAIGVGLNGWWTGPEIRYGLVDSEPTVLVADERRLARLDGEDPGVPTIVIERDFDAIWRARPGVDLPDQPIAEDDPAIVLYTSGTTGRPKGAINTHRNVGALLGLNFFHGLRMMMFNPPDEGAPPTTQLVTSPLFHVSGLHNAAIAFAASGIRSVWTTGRFDPEAVCTLIERERITGWSFTTALLHRFANHPGLADHDLTSLRTIGGGGSPLSRELQRQTREALPWIAPSLGLGYGQTECAALATLNSGEELVAFPDSVGRPLPTVEIEVRDADGRALADGAEGEICVRGPMVMPGYWRRPDASAEVLAPVGWLRTGDIGRMEGGRLYLASRKRDLILRGGENVYPVEIEQRLELHPAIAESAVIGVDHPELGQEVKAVVVACPGAAGLDFDELARWVAEELAYFKVPVHWEQRTDPLPRNASGKVVKHALGPGASSGFVEE
ncbi:MAG TPA: class I adenylate-forming enzyme family protein [Acidimicrobiia bacterium]|nr:class I adenylate-forming enzyme family protein [Acidimicrobiia bacterium]